MRQAGDTTVSSASTRALHFVFVVHTGGGDAGVVETLGVCP